MVGRARSDAYNWRTWPELPPDRAAELSKQLLQCETTVGVMGSVHLEKVQMAQGINAALGRCEYAWIFATHDIVMGDMNTRWKDMIGGAEVQLGHGPSRPQQQREAFVSPEQHSCANRPGGTYLPGVLEPVAWIDRKTGKPVPGKYKPIEPQTIDLVVVRRPLHVELRPEQPGVKLQTCKLPRALMQSLGWCSDHTSVVASVRSGGGAQLTFATWNVASPRYVERFWPDASFGFGWQPEEARLAAIEAHVLELLEVAEVVGLQEVPVALVQTLVAHGSRRRCQVQWVNAGSQYDEPNIPMRGLRGCSTEAGGIEAALPLAPAMYDMLLVRVEALRHPAAALEHMSLAESAAAAAAEAEAEAVAAAEAAEAAEGVVALEAVPDNWDDSDVD